LTLTEFGFSNPSLVCVQQASHFHVRENGENSDVTSLLYFCSLLSSLFSLFRFVFFAFLLVSLLSLPGDEFLKSGDVFSAVVLALIGESMFTKSPQTLPLPE
jgi:hypothetical protein